MPRRKIAPAFLLAACTFATACIRLPHAVENVPPGEWLARHGDTRNAMFADERVPASVTIEWEEGFGRGLPAMPIVHDDLVITVVSGGGIATASAITGERYWSRRFNGSIAGQALRVGDRVFVSTHHRSGNIYALELARGRRAWSRKLDARPTAEPAWADDMLFQPTDRGEVIAFSGDRGEEMWRTATGGITSLPLVVAGPQLLLVQRDTLVLIDRFTGMIQGRHTLADVPVAPLAVAGDTIVTVGGTGRVTAYAELGARQLWQHDAGGPIVAAPIVAREGVYVLTRTAALMRITPLGSERVVQLDGAATESITLTADGLLVGLLDGRLQLVRREGTIAWQEQLPGSLRAPPAVRRSSVYAATLNGRLIKLSP
jgi:outer membrane protein assembly factor BamB